jgi:hypothetical protein
MRRPGPDMGWSAIKEEEKDIISKHDIYWARSKKELSKSQGHIRPQNLLPS